MPSRSVDLVRRGGLALILGACVLLAQPGPATLVSAQQAAPPLPALAVSGITQTDLDGDGRPDLTTLDASWVTTSDRVLVYDGGGDMRPSDDWTAATDFLNDTWIFDAGADDRPELIVTFGQTADGVQAQVFDDANSDRRVSYTVNGAAVTVTESPFPSLTVSARGGWTRPDGGPTYNLTFLTDGPLAARDLPPQVLPLTKRDGVPDSELEYGDENDDGIPDFLVSRLLTETPIEWALSRTGVGYNVGQVRPQRFTPPTFWWLLGGDPNAAKLNDWDTTPAIDVDWAASRIVSAGNAGYPLEHGYRIGSLIPLQPNIRNVVDFENMMGWYDLADDRDGYPELLVRNRYFDEFDRYGEKVSPALDIIRYSWNQNNVAKLVWDYKLGLAGRHPITQTVTVGTYPLAIVPFDELPGWVTSQKWDYATFVAREGDDPGYASSEGIYEWESLEDDPATRRLSGVDYLMGNTMEPPLKNVATMRTGYRGEYSFHYDAQPYLYASAVDRKLHLFQAEGGFWNVDDRAEVRYSDLDKDGYIDQWWYVEPDDAGQKRATRNLNVAGNFLVYGDDAQVVLKQSTVAPSLFATLPPTNHAEWDTLGRALADARRDWAPSDLRAMLDQFDGAATTITGARVRDYRPLAPNAFRFVIEVSDGFAVDGADPAGLASLTPGAYLVTYDQGFTTVPAGSPSISLNLSTRTLEGGDLTAFASAVVQVDAANDGLQDSSDLTLVVDRQRGNEIQEVARQPFPMLSEEPAHATLVWPPSEPGPWNLRARLVRPDGQVVTTAGQELDVRQNLRQDGLEAGAFFNAEGRPPLAALPLVVLALMVGWVVRSALVAGGRKGA